MISRLLNIAPRLALSTVLAISCFKGVVIDKTIQEISEADSVSVGVIAFSVCKSITILVVAADIAANKFISRYNNKKKHSFSHNTSIASASAEDLEYAAPPLTAPIAAPTIIAHPYSIIIEDFPSPTSGLNRYSFSSETTLVAEDEDEDDYNKVKDFASPPRSYLRPLHLVAKLQSTSTDAIDILTEKTQSFPFTRSSESFGVPYVSEKTDADYLQDEYDEILAMQADFVDGWAASMKKLGLKSMLDTEDEDELDAFL